MVKDQLNKEVVYSFPFCFFLLEYVFGMYFNDVFSSFLGFSDEILCISLLLWTLKYTLLQKREFFNREIIVFWAIAFFYLFYSFYIKSNVVAGILGDFLIQLKPFIAYFMLGYIGFSLNNRQKEITKNVSIVLFSITLMIVFVGILSGDLLQSLYYVYGHATRYGTALILIGITYLYCSDFKNKKELLVVLAMFVFSLLAMRAKIYGFCAIAIVVIVIMRGNVELRISLKNVFFLVLLISLAVYVARDKIIFYFFDFNTDSQYSLARPALYVTAWEILLDYFPFGSGLASFASHYSGVFYSHIYVDYQLDGIWGLLEEEPAFVTDTQYPAIAQFGFVGLFLYIVFFSRIIKRSKMLKKYNSNKNLYLVFLFGLIFLAIESIGDAVLTSNRGFYCMILIAIALNEGNSKQEQVNT